MIRGEACARAANELRSQGFHPDLICAHSGWGESLFLRDVWPNVPLLSYQEFFYRAQGFDFDFDPELQAPLHWEACANLRMKNANNLSILESSSWNISPTFFQRSSFPSSYHNQISVIHDGIDVASAAPDPSVEFLDLPNGVTITNKDQVVTFVNRRIEPYRGCLSFIRSIPAILKSSPNAQVVIVGGHEGVSYGKQPPVSNWKDLSLAQIDGKYDVSRLHFTGNLSYNDYLKLLKLSACHVYLTYPFVLSWSMLEAMSIGLPIVGSSTPPVQEVIRDGHNGVLVDFFSPSEIANAVVELLSNRRYAESLGCEARQTILSNYSIEQCVPRHLQLLKLVADGVIQSSPDAHIRAAYLPPYLSNSS